MLEYTESKQLKVKEGRKRVGHANSAMFPFSQELLLSKIPWEFLHDNCKGILPLDVEPLFQAPWEGVCTVISIRSHGKVQSNKIPLILECHQIRSHGCAVVKALVFLAAF